MSSNDYTHGELEVRHQLESLLSSSMPHCKTQRERQRSIGFMMQLFNGKEQLLLEQLAAHEAATTTHNTLELLGQGLSATASLSPAALLDPERSLHDGSFAHLPPAICVDDVPCERHTDAATSELAVPGTSSHRTFRPPSIPIVEEKQQDPEGYLIQLEKAWLDNVKLRNIIVAQNQAIQSQLVQDLRSPLSTACADECSLVESRNDDVGSLAPASRIQRDLATLQDIHSQMMRLEDTPTAQIARLSRDLGAAIASMTNSLSDAQSVGPVSLARSGHKSSMSSFSGGSVHPLSINSTRVEAHFTVEIPAPATQQIIEGLNEGLRMVSADGSEVASYVSTPALVTLLDSISSDMAMGLFTNWDAKDNVWNTAKGVLKIPLDAVQDVVFTTQDVCSLEIVTSSLPGAKVRLVFGSTSIGTMWFHLLRNYSMGRDTVAVPWRSECPPSHPLPSKPKHWFDESCGSMSDLEAHCDDHTGNNTSLVSPATEPPM